MLALHGSRVLHPPRFRLTPSPSTGTCSRVVSAHVGLTRTNCYSCHCVGDIKSDSITYHHQSRRRPHGAHSTHEGLPKHRDHCRNRQEPTFISHSQHIKDRMQAGISEDVDDAGMNCGKFANGLEKVTLAFDVGRVARAARSERHHLWADRQ